MMQTLVFESAWDKTIAPEDRAAIIDLFQKTKQKSVENIAFSPISKAYNHREDLLVMVLVHNFTNQLFSFEKMDLVYKENNKTIASNEFSYTALTLESRMSMPWTFIFPPHTQKETAILENGYLFFQSDC